MTNKTLNTLTKKYDPSDSGPFVMLGSETLFYPALDALEYYYKNTLLKWNPLNCISSEEDREYYEGVAKEVEYLKTITKQNIELGKAIIEDGDCQRYHFKRVKEFFNNYANILVFAEEISK